MPIRSCLLAALALAFAVAAPFATPDRYKGLPQTVIADVQSLEERCGRAGGIPRWNAVSLVKTVNLSPDRIPDYVVDSRAMHCDEQGGTPLPRPWARESGSELVVWASVTRHHWIKALDRDDVLSWHMSGAPQHVLAITTLALPCRDIMNGCQQLFAFTTNRLTALAAKPARRVSTHARAEWRLTEAIR